MYNGIYTALIESTAVSAGGNLIELQVPADTQIEIIRCWIGPAEGDVPVVEVQEVRLYGNDASGSGGSTPVVGALQGTDDAATAVTALGAVGIGATPTTLHRDAFHLQLGWYYVPLPDERIRVAGGSIFDNFGLEMPVAPDASVTISYGIVWGELG